MNIQENTTFKCSKYVGFSLELISIRLTCRTALGQPDSGKILHLFSLSDSLAFSVKRGRERTRHVASANQSLVRNVHFINI